MVAGKAPSPEKPEGEDWARVYFVLANEVGIKWPEILEVEHFMLGVYFEQALYDRALRGYEARMNSPL